MLYSCHDADTTTDQYRPIDIDVLCRRAQRRWSPRAYLARADTPRALIGKEEGDSVEVKTPGGDRGYEVLTVRYI